jgi:hypothetical protein
MADGNAAIVRTFPQAGLAGKLIGLLVRMMQF